MGKKRLLQWSRMMKILELNFIADFAAIECYNKQLWIDNCSMCDCILILFNLYLEFYFKQPFQQIASFHDHCRIAAAPDCKTLCVQYLYLSISLCFADAVAAAATAAAAVFFYCLLISHIWCKILALWCNKLHSDANYYTPNTIYCSHILSLVH